MMKRLVLILCFTAVLVSASSTKKKLRAKLPHHMETKWPPSYRDHVYRYLSDNGKALFYALQIHPSCRAKGGECIKRGACIEKKMLYISRACYLRDLVCCYDDTIRTVVIDYRTDPKTVAATTTSEVEEI